MTPLTLRLCRVIQHAGPMLKDIAFVTILTTSSILPHALSSFTFHKFTNLISVFWILLSNQATSVMLNIFFFILVPTLHIVCEIICISVNFDIDCVPSIVFIVSFVTKCDTKFIWITVTSPESLLLCYRRGSLVFITLMWP